MEVFIEESDLDALESCIEVADPGDSIAGASDDAVAIWNKAKNVAEGLRLMLPVGSTKRLRVVVE